MKRLILLRLVDMLVGVLLVPSLTLPVAHGVVDLAPVFLAITRDAHLCKHNTNAVRPDEESTLGSHCLTAKKWSLRHLRVPSSYRQQHRIRFSDEITLFTKVTILAKRQEIEKVEKW